MIRSGSACRSQKAFRPGSSAFRSTVATSRTSPSAYPAWVRACVTAAAMRPSGTPRRQPTPSVRGRAASLAVVMTGAAPQARATAYARAFPPPSCPPRMGMTCRAASSRTSTAGSRVLSRGRPDRKRTAIPAAPISTQARAPGYAARKASCWRPSVQGRYTVTRRPAAVSARSSVPASAHAPACTGQTPTSGGLLSGGPLCSAAVTSPDCPPRGGSGARRRGRTGGSVRSARRGRPARG